MPFVVQSLSEAALFADLSKLWDASDFVPRQQCGNWSELLIWLSQISDLLISLAYISIPCSLLVLWYGRRHRVFISSTLLLFVSFIFLCSLTHLCQVLVFRWPAYRLFVLINFITGIVSLATAASLPGLVAQLLSSPDIAELLEESTLSRTVQLSMQSHINQLTAEKSILQMELASERQLVMGLGEVIENIRGYSTVQEALNDKKIASVLQSLRRMVEQVGNTKHASEQAGSRDHPERLPGDHGGSGAQT
jgi:hypothetical protein